MISIYRALFILSVLLVLASLILPTSRGVPIGMSLTSQPESWNFTFGAADHRLNGVTEEETKQKLLLYLNDHLLRDEASLHGVTTPALVAAVFSFIGWYRERDFQRRTG